jgi:hypothetical protein
LRRRRPSQSPLPAFRRLSFESDPTDLHSRFLDSITLEDTTVEINGAFSGSLAALGATHELSEPVFGYSVTKTFRTEELGTGIQLLPEIPSQRPTTAREALVAIDEIQVLLLIEYDSPRSVLWLPDLLSCVASGALPAGFDAQAFFSFP